MLFNHRLQLSLHFIQFILIEEQFLKHRTLLVTLSFVDLHLPLILIHLAVGLKLREHLQGRVRHAAHSYRFLVFTRFLQVLDRLLTELIENVQRIIPVETDFRGITQSQVLGQFTSEEGDGFGKSFLDFSLYNLIFL
jgi:hypothetical protein